MYIFKVYITIRLSTYFYNKPDSLAFVAATAVVKITSYFCEKVVF